MLLQEELEHSRLCVENYPTDMRMKYEYGKRLVRARRYEDAIPMFQEARTDPRYRIVALNSIGQCFFHKEWYTDAVEMFQQALELVETGDDAQIKELRYNLGRAYEADGNVEEALANFRRVAQVDYNYLDVKNRVDTLRKRQQGT
jgi:tetratricopeptide (TPR) repeat protein